MNEWIGMAIWLVGMICGYLIRIAYEQHSDFKDKVEKGK